MLMSHGSLSYCTQLNLMLVILNMFQWRGKTLTMFNINSTCKIMDLSILPSLIFPCASSRQHAAHPMLCLFTFSWGWVRPHFVSRGTQSEGNGLSVSSGKQHRWLPSPQKPQLSLGDSNSRLLLCSLVSKLILFYIHLSAATVWNLWVLLRSLFRLADVWH